MNNRKINDSSQLTASKDALKVIYYVIIGIAITQSLDGVFIDSGVFVGVNLFDHVHLIPFFLLMAFLPTICRFVHGASIHLDSIHTGTFKTLIDFVGFFLQAIFFYLMALTIDNIVVFAVLFIMMLLMDAIWLITLCVIGYQNFKGTACQWVFSDAILVVVLLASSRLSDLNVISSLLTAIFILVASLSATFFDYFQNKSFYFPGHE